MRVGLLAALLLVACEDRPPPRADAASRSFDLSLLGADGGTCLDPCPVARGIVVGCAHRFAYGTNWAWHHFGADFGGVAAWGQAGVAASIETLRPALRQMREEGAQV